MSLHADLLFKVDLFVANYRARESLFRCDFNGVIEMLDTSLINFGGDAFLQS